MKKLFLLLIILLLFTSCKKKETIETPAETITTIVEGVTIVEEVGMKNVFASNRMKPANRYNFLEANFSDTVFIMNNRIYAASKMGVDKETGYFYEKVLHSYDMNGENEEFIIITPVIENSTVEFMWYDSMYNIITIEQLDYKYTLNKRAETGEIHFTLQLNITDEIISMGIGENDNIYFGTKNKVFIYSNNGDFICDLSLDYQLDYISSAHGRKPILKMYDTNNYVKYRYINYETKAFEELEMPLTSVYYEYSNILYGDGFDYYHVNNNGVYGYDIETNTLTKKLDWINSDIKFMRILTFSIISPDKMLLIQFDYSVAFTTFTILDRLNDNEITEKIYLSIGYINPYSDAYLEGIVYNFNKDNDKYRITIKNYYSQYDELDPMLRLNNDIASGNSPDMIHMNNYLSILNYSKNDMFVDLNDYLDEELKSNLLPIAKDSTINNKLYQMITSFSVTTLMGKTDNIGENTAWSFNDVINLYNQLPKEKVLSLDFTKFDLTNYILPYLIPYYVDYDNGVCEFNKQDFKEFIELYKIVPDDYLGYNLPDFENTIYRNDEVLVGSVVGIDVSSFIMGKGRYFRDNETTIIGYPTPDGENHCDIINAKGFSILNTSANKEIAWDFIKYCLSDEYAEISVFESGYIIPTKIGIVLTNSKYYNMYIYVTDDFKTMLHSEIIEKVESQYGSGVYLHIDGETIDEFSDYLYSLNSYVHKDTDVINIINDELTNYINTNKSIDDTIKAIQSRVSIYMSEVWG
jgi:ABC-type sugar transport system, periplasmic component